MIDDEDFRSLCDKVDSIATEQTETKTALSILVKEVQGLRDDVKPMAVCQERINRICTEHDQRATVVRAMKTDVAAVKQAVGLRADGTSKLDDLTTTITQHKVYFAIVGVLGTAALAFMSGVGQAVVKFVLGL